MNVVMQDRPRFLEVSKVFNTCRRDILWVRYDHPMDSILFLPILLFPMGFLWGPCGLPMGSLWLPVDFLWNPNRIPTGSPWFPCGFPAVSLWNTQSYLRGIHLEICWDHQIHPPLIRLPTVFDSSDCFIPNVSTSRSPIPQIPGARRA